MNNEYGVNNSISFDFKENYNSETGKLIIDLNSLEGVNDPKAVEVLFVENISSENGNNYISETSLIRPDIGNNIITLNLIAKAKELFVGLNSDNSKFKKNLQNILGEKSNDDVQMMLNLIYSIL